MGIEVFLLGLLAVARILRRRRAWCVALLLTPALASVACAADREDTGRWYAGLSLVNVRNTDGAATMDRRLAAQGYTTDTTLSGQTRMGGSVFAGRGFGRFAAELGYVTLGRMDTRIEGDTPVDETYLQAISRAHPRSGEGPQASVLLSLPLSERFGVFGRAGLFWWRNTQTARSGDDSVRGADRRLDPMMSLGLSFRPRPLWSLRAATEVYRLDGERVSTLQVALVRDFTE